MSETNYTPHMVRLRNKYECLCGSKFFRQVSDYFTMGPANKLSLEENKEKITNQLKVLKKPCPDCQTRCLPIVREPEYV